MTDVITLQNEIEQLKNSTKGYIAQIDAAKQMYNEMANSCLQLRTHMNVNNTHMQEIAAKLQERDTTIAALKEQIQTLIGQINELTPKE